MGSDFANSQLARRRDDGRGARLNWPDTRFICPDLRKPFVVVGSASRPRSVHHDNMGSEMMSGSVQPDTVKSEALLR